MAPKQIKVVDKKKLFIKWIDDSESSIDLKFLRDECPCASCKGETVLLKTYKPAKPTAQSPEAYQIKNIEQVGGYAIQISWKDGHNTGIYTWQYLNELAEGKSSDYDNIV